MIPISKITARDMKKRVFTFVWTPNSRAHYSTRYLCEAYENVPDYVAAKLSGAKPNWDLEEGRDTLHAFVALGWITYKELDPWLDSLSVDERIEFLKASKI